MSACGNCGGRTRVLVVLTEHDGSEYALCRRCFGNDGAKRTETKPETKKGTRT